MVKRPRSLPIQMNKQFGLSHNQFKITLTQRAYAFKQSYALTLPAQLFKVLQEPNGPLVTKWPAIVF